MGIKISDMTADSDIGGAEVIPVSDSGSPKSITPAGIGAYVIDLIEAISATLTGPLTDYVFILQDSALKPVLLSTVAQNVITSVWGKDAETAVDAADLLALKDGGTDEKTVTALILSTYIRSTIVASDLAISGVSPAGALVGADVYLVWQGGGAKQTTLTALTAAILAGFKAYMTALSAVSTSADSDVFYVSQGGTEKKVTLTTIKAAINAVLAPASPPENYVPQWGSAQKTLKDGLLLQDSVRADGTAVDTALPTEKAVRDALTPATLTGTGVALRIGGSTTEGLETFVVDTTITLGAIAGVAVATIPLDAILKSVQGNVETAATGGSTTVKIGIGIASSPSLLGLTSGLTKNLKIDTLLDYVELLDYTVDSAETTVPVLVYPCATDGTIGDAAFTAGTLRVRIVYDRLTSLDDAE